MNNIEGISDIRKEKIYNIEKQNIENIKKVIEQTTETRKNSKNNLTTREYQLQNSIIYKLTKDGNDEDYTIVISPNKLKGLAWNDLTNIQENNYEWQTNIESGIWITCYKNKIRYTISKDKKVLVGIQLVKAENEVTISYFAQSQEIEKQIQENAKNEILLIDILKSVNYNIDGINTILDELNINCVTVNTNEIKIQALVEEKEELQKNVDLLTEQINGVKKQIDEISKQANIAEKETKKTIEEIGRVTKENESLKNSIVNVRKAIAKKCAYIPIIGRLIIKELNKEFGENMLPEGK